MLPNSRNVGLNNFKTFVSVRLRNLGKSIKDPVVILRSLLLYLKTLFLLVVTILMYHN